MQFPQCLTRKSKTFQVYEFTSNTETAIPFAPRVSQSVDAKHACFTDQLREMMPISSGDRTDRMSDSLVHILDDGIGARLVDRFGRTVPTVMAPSVIVVLSAIGLRYKCDLPQAT
jgi:hypothetical protein